MPVKSAMKPASVQGSSAARVSVNVSKPPAAPPPRVMPRPAQGNKASSSSSDEAPILFQNYFKSVGPRTYAAQVKQARNGNQFLVLTEGKRDAETGQLRKTRLFVYSEDFSPFFRMLHETAQWIKANPVPPEVKARREKFWARHRNGKVTKI